MPTPQTPDRSVFTEQPNFAEVTNSTDANNFGAGIARGLDQLSAGLRAQAEAKAEADALDAYAKASIERQNLLYNPDDGIYSRTGATVDKEPERFTTETGRIADRYSQGLSPEAAKSFNSMWTRSNLSDREGVTKHVLSETEKYKQSAAKAVAEAALGNAVKGFNDPAVIRRSKSEIAGAVMFQLKGQAPEVIDEAIKMKYSELHMGVIQQLNADDVNEAYSYFKLNKAEMTPTDYVQAQTIMRPKLYEQRVATETDGIVKSGGAASSAWKTMYPEIFGKDVSPEAQKRAAVEALIPPRFIPDGQTRAALMGLIQQESSFNPNDVTPNPHLDKPTSWMRRNGGQPGDGTVVGLTQVMVFNARNISRELGDGLMAGKSTEEIIDLLKNPEINVRYGSYQFGKSLKKFGGDIEAALVDYNSGRGEQWLKAGRDYSVIPNGAKLYGGMTAREQTMDYVRKVMRNYRNNLSADTPKTYASFRASADNATSEEVNQQFLAIAGMKSSKAISDLEPTFRYSAGAMLIGAPDDIKKDIQWDGVLTGDGSSINLTYKSDAARAWVADNAAKFGLNIPQGTDRLERVDSGAPATTEAKDGSEVPAAANVATVYEEPSLDSWLARADAISDPKLRKDVTSQLRARWELAQKAEKDRVDEVKQQMWQLALKGEAIPDEMYQQVTPAYANQLRSYQEAIKRGEKIQTDWRVWSDVMRMSPEELAKMDPFTLRNQLADAQFTRLGELVRDARGDATGHKKGLVAQTRSTQEIISSVSSALGKDPEAKAKFSAAMDQEIDNFFVQNKRNPTATEKIKMADELMIGGYYAEGKHVFQIQRGETVELKNIDVQIKDIPDARYQALQANYRSSTGTAIDENQARDLFGAQIIAGRGAVAKCPSWARGLLVKYAKDNGRPLPDEAQLNDIFTKWAVKIGGAK